MENKRLFDNLINKVMSLGAYKANVIEASDIESDVSFRDICATNACGVYGKCWMCPPDIGDIHEMMQKLTTYKYALVYQIVGELEDSYDFEGMQETGNKLNDSIQELRSFFANIPIEGVLFLGAGGCRVCETCTKRTNEPCRSPELAIPSLESYGINVSKMAAASGMKYINGQDTVTYFGAVFFNLGEESV